MIITICIVISPHRSTTYVRR